MKSILIALGVTAAIVGLAFGLVVVLFVWMNWSMRGSDWRFWVSPIGMGYFMLIFLFRSVLKDLRSESP